MEVSLMQKSLEIISTPEQTRHLLLPLTNFTLDSAEPDFWKYDYCYLHLSDQLLNDIVELRQVMLSGSLKHDWHCIPIKEPLLLLTTAAVFEPASESISGFEHVKLDSISFIVDKPSFNGLDTKQATAHLICKQDEFKLAAEYAAPEALFPHLLFHGPPIEYHRIEKLLNNPLTAPR